MGCKASHHTSNPYHPEKPTWAPGADIDVANAVTHGKATKSKGPSARLASLKTPADDVIHWASGFGESRMLASGSDGWVYIYDSARGIEIGSFRPHHKAVSRVVPVNERTILTSSNDATVKLWSLSGEVEPVLTFTGHAMSVSAMDLLDWTEDGQLPNYLFTGSRDCSVRLWDMATAKELHQKKILRNVVTAVRTIPGQLNVVQASEDLHLRVWDTRTSLDAVHAVRTGPNQLIALDVTQDGFYAVCGSKGFSRENCEVKVFDLRMGLKQLASLPVADQTIEALRVVAPDRCLVASKDGHIRTLSIPDIEIIQDRGPAIGAYSALGVTHLATGELVALAAISSPSGTSLEMLAWPGHVVDKPAVLWATTASDDSEP
mmetsp:Transcript_23406/g.49914  ORF Transcript_23406/g.49914 Transcript_23406/m.49914 type:complete len:376 (-) Transcript_23406:308-1435(-)